MIVNGERFRPAKLHSEKKVLIRPKSGIMSLNPEPSSPTERQSHDLPPKSYADAVEDAGDSEVNEESIKETPPRPTRHNRQTSEPRPLGEVMDEAEREQLNRSPSLRHTKGRLEEKGSWEGRNGNGINGMLGGDAGYAAAVKAQPPATDNVIMEGNGVPPAALKVTTNRSTNGDRTPETYEAVGEDESPRSPVRKGHKRVSSKSLREMARTQAQQQQQTHLEEELSPRSQPTFPSIGVDAPEPSTDEQNQKPGQLIYENLRNKSGENLASIKPSDGYRLSLQQREDKPPTSEPPGEAAKAARRMKRRDSELTSGRRAGAGWSKSAIRWAPLNVPIQRRLQTMMVLAHTLSIVGSVAFFFLLCTIPLLWPILVPYLLYVLLSRASVDGSLYFRSEYLRSSKVWSLFAGYFPARLHRSAVLEPTRKYIFGYHPHGIISHGAFAAFATEALGFGQLFPGITNTLLTLDSNFRMPLYRDYALRMGLASVSRESCENILSRGGPNGEGMGRAITIVIGGARESLDAKPYTLRLVLKRRKGFVKLAIRTGADLVPVLAFGENDIYEQFDAAAHPWIHKAQLAVKKLMGFTVPLFHARGVFNYDVGLMPYRRPINIVVGKPINIQQNKSPDPAYVDKVHEAYVNELMRIWDEWKDTFARHRQGELEVVE